jgi:hypothetical protein
VNGRPTAGHPEGTHPALMCLAVMKRAQMRPIYRSPNGDAWFLGHDPATGLAFVRHEANIPSGGQVTEMEIGAFLSEPQHPEQEALLRLIGIPDTQGADPDDDQPVVNTGKEWSDGATFELGKMLVRGRSIEEIARSLRRDHGDVQDKVVEVGRAGSAANMSEPARVFEDRKSPGDWRVEKFDDDGGAEVTIFGGPNAPQRAIQYADWRYCDFEEVSLAPMPDIVEPC